MKTRQVVILIPLLLVVLAGAMAWFTGIRILLLPPVGNEEDGATVIMRGLDVLPLVTDAGTICIDPDARVVTSSESNADRPCQCSRHLLVPVRHAGTDEPSRTAIRAAFDTYIETQLALSLSGG